MNQTQKILIVDDTPANAKLLEGTLREEYRILVATNGLDAVEICTEHLPDLVLLDIMMPGMDGYEVCQILKENDRTRQIPIIFVTAMDDYDDEKKGLSIGAVDYITKPIRTDILKARIKNHLTLKRYQDRLEELVQERTRELDLTKDATIHSFAVLAEYRDPETGSHIKRTQNYVKLLARHIRYEKNYREFLNNDETITLLFKSAPLHDIGKVGVRDSILLKPGPLTKEEFDEMKFHPVYGRDAIVSAETMLGSNSFLHFAREIAYSHHEKWDGSGYPTGAKGEDIPLSGRLMAVADVYDALISKRVYKPAFPHEKAVAIIAEGRGSHFDPTLVDAFLDLNAEFQSIACQHAEPDSDVPT